MVNILGLRRDSTCWVVVGRGHHARVEERVNMHGLCIGPTYWVEKGCRPKIEEGVNSQGLWRGRKSTCWYGKKKIAWLVKKVVQNMLE